MEVVERLLESYWLLLCCGGWCASGGQWNNYNCYRPWEHLFLRRSIIFLLAPPLSLANDFPCNSDLQGTSFAAWWASPLLGYSATIPGNVLANLWSSGVGDVVALSLLELEGPGEFFLIFSISLFLTSSSASHNQQLPLCRQCSPSQLGLYQLLCCEPTQHHWWWRKWWPLLPYIATTLDNSGRDVLSPLIFPISRASHLSGVPGVPWGHTALVSHQGTLSREEWTIPVLLHSLQHLW